jgi:YegS/Rv2252/BmrU family lipid kinase
LCEILIKPSSAKGFVEKIAFIINPISGVHAKRDLPELIAGIFSPSEGYDSAIYYTKCAGDATAAARNFATQDFAKVVAVGGDGTVNEVASGLIHTHTALGIVPMGSGNGLARHLNIPINKRRSLELIKTAKVETIDYGLLNDAPFFCTAGVGFDALVGNRFAMGASRGLITYIKHIITEYPRYTPERYAISIDGGKPFYRKAFLVTVANASQWGNNAHIAPQASLRDGVMDVVVMSKFPFYAVPYIGLAFFTKRVDKTRYIETFHCSNLRITRQCPGYIHFDGEASEAGNVIDVKIVTHGLKVLPKDRCEI